MGVMATQTVGYSRDGQWSFRQLRWRQIVLLLIAAYVVLYAVMRGTGVITHSWGVPTSKVSSMSYATHLWECRSDAVGTVFIPAIALEQAVRDIDWRKSP